MLLPLTAQAAVSGDRCTGPCPENADCICGIKDTPLVLVDGVWVKKPADGKKSQSIPAAKKPAVGVKDKAGIESGK